MYYNTPMTFILLVLALLLSLFMIICLDIFLFSIKKGGVARVISVILLFYLQIVLTELLLGAAFLLNDTVLSALNLTISTLLLWVIYNKSGRDIFYNYLANVRQSTRKLRTAYHNKGFLVLLTSLFSIFMLWTVFVGVIFPPLDWDGNDYHLQYTGELIQNHHIWDTAAQRPWITGYPKGGEMIQAWLPLISHNDMLIELSQVPFVILGILSLYVISRRIGVSQPNAIFTSTLFAFTPIVMHQITTGYIDVMLPSLFYAGIALATQKRITKLDYLLIGFSISLLISIKQTAVYLALGILVFLATNLYTIYGKHYKQYLTPLVLMSLSLPIGAYWYIKNWIIYGSPIYPFGLRVGGIPVFAGMDLSKWTQHKLSGLPGNIPGQWLYTWSEYGPRNGAYPFAYNYDGSYYGLGPLWFIILVPSIILAIYLATKHRNTLFLKLVAIFFGVLILIPSSYSPRYTIFIVGIGVLALGLTLTHLHRYTSIIIKSMITALSIITIAANFQLISASPKFVMNQLRSISSGSGLRGPGTAFDINIGHAYTVVRSSAKSGDTVAYTDANWTYPLWNNHFSNKVIYVEGADEAAWLSRLKDDSVDFVFTTKGSSVKQSLWASDNLKDIIYEDNKNVVYKVN